MTKKKKPILVANWRGNVSNLLEAKRLLADLDKEYKKLVLEKYKKNKKKPTKDKLSFFLALPAPLIYPIKDYLKSTPRLKNILVGAQGFDEVEKTHKNNQITLGEIRGVGAHFTLLNKNNDTYTETFNPIVETLDLTEETYSKITNDLILSRLNQVSQKVNLEQKKKSKPNQELTEEERGEARDLLEIAEQIRVAITSNLATILVIKNSKGDLNYLINFIKTVVENLHYNLFNRLIICYETKTVGENIDYLDLEDCQESVIAIRRTISNIFGIDNAKKVKIIYSGRINESNVKEILENASVDGILLNEESVYPKLMAKILTELT